MGARRCKGTGRGESPNAKEEAAGTPAEESRRREVGGGDQAPAPAAPAAPLPLQRLAESSERDEGRPDGDFSPMFVGRA